MNDDVDQQEQHNKNKQYNKDQEEKKDKKSKKKKPISQKQITGILKKYDKEKIILQLAQPIETTVEIPRNNITNIKLRYRW